VPTSTFYNLPEEKRSKLVGAIKDEFSRVLFDEVSINKIIHAAEIPRGSFYQYFSDKNDMLGFILLDYQKQIFEQVKASLRANNGDVFTMINDVFAFTVALVMEEKANNFCMNLFADIKVNSKFYLKWPMNASDVKMYEELKPLINFQMLDLRDENDFPNILDTLFLICRTAIAEVFLNISNCELVNLKYQQKLELLGRGFMRNKECKKNA